jgi:hypothetical protein
VEVKKKKVGGDGEGEETWALGKMLLAHGSIGNSVKRASLTRCPADAATSSGVPLRETEIWGGPIKD